MSLKVEKLKVTIQKKEILHGINLEVKQGEFVSLLGPSGCGKTTLLKSIAGLVEVQEGEVWIQGEKATNILPEKRGTIIVFQDLRLFPNMTVEKNIAFPMEIAGVKKDERKKKVAELLAAVQLSGFEKRRIREMSGGQMQRVALARALAAKPKILLLDEPFSGLDEKLRLEMGELVRKLHETWKITTILVTHDKREALQMSDRIALMDSGRLIQYDTPKEMFYHPTSRMVAEYFGKVNVMKKEHDGRMIVGILRLFSVQIAKVEGKENKNDISIHAKVEEITFAGELAEVSLILEEPYFGRLELLSQVMSSKISELNLSGGMIVAIKINEKDIVWFESGEV